MKTSINNFYKTEHFLLRQWERKISDQCLKLVLEKVKQTNQNTLIIVSRKVLRKLNVNMNQELFVKVDDNTLITCFYCDFKNYNPQKRNQEYLIINK